MKEKRKSVSKKSKCDSATSQSCRPFLKWAGGKGQLLDELLKRIPDSMERYVEPFVGGGALLFSLQPKKALILDINAELINAYQVVKSDVESLIKSLRKHVYEEDYYYSMRDADRLKSFARWASVRKASRLIYLNKTCFNGLYRVNSKGLFNVPFGRYTNPRIVDPENLRGCSRLLKRVQIRQGSFEIIEQQLRSGDFVYFDPPYVPLNSTSYFTAYDRNGFDLKSQEALFELCCRLDKKGIPFMLSNSYSSFVRSRYKKFRVELVKATRAVNSKSEARGKINELIIRNY